MPLCVIFSLEGESPMGHGRKLVAPRCFITARSTDLGCVCLLFADYDAIIMAGSLNERASRKR